MNGNDVLIDLLEDNRRRLHRVLQTLSDACLAWRPEAGANNILITLWHMARIFDVFVTQQAQGLPATAETWFQHGWTARTGYDPRGIGQEGWGMLTGYSQTEVAAMPEMSREVVVGYLDDVYDRVKAYVADTPMAALQTPAAGWEGRLTKYSCVQMALMDNVRHLGEIFAIKASWERQTLH